MRKSLLAMYSIVEGVTRLNALSWNPNEWIKRVGNLTLLTCMTRTKLSSALTDLITVHPRFTEHQFYYKILLPYNSLRAQFQPGMCKNQTFSRSHQIQKIREIITSIDDYWKVKNKNKKLYNWNSLYIFFKDIVMLLPWGFYWLINSLL